MRFHNFLDFFISSATATFTAFSGQVFSLLTQIDFQCFSCNRFETQLQLPKCCRSAIQRSVIVVSAERRRASFTLPLSPLRRAGNSFASSD
jgi:hypothetical protein